MLYFIDVLDSGPVFEEELDRTFLLDQFTTPFAYLQVLLPIEGLEICEQQDIGCYSGCTGQLFHNWQAIRYFIGPLLPVLHLYA